MSSSVIDTTISGFYYDQQMKNEGLTMSLHPSTKPGPADTYWQLANEVIYGDGGIKYSKLPVVKAIVGEDFQIAVANQWDDSSIIDDAVGMFNSAKPLAAFAEFFKGEADQMVESGRKAEGTAETSLGRGGQKLANDIVELGSKAASVASQYLNRALVVQGSRFSYYNGSSIGFGNMSLKFTLLSDWDSSGKWTSCIDKIKGPAGEGCSYGLLDYCVGKYVKWSKNTDQNDVLNQFVGWQLPPGGFKADLKNVDNIQYGTLMLIIGDMYAIPNLVIQDAQFTFSKQVVKHPKSEYEIDLVPMYCDVQLTLKPASKYTDVSFLKAIDGSMIAQRKKDFIRDVNSRIGGRMTITASPSSDDVDFESGISDSLKNQKR